MKDIIYNDPEEPQEELLIPDINRYLDSTILKHNTTPDQVTAICESAVRYNFRSVRVPPSMVSHAHMIIRNQLQNKDVLIGTVVGYPLGYDTVKAKRAAMCEALINGANEVDVVLSYHIKMQGFIFEELNEYSNFAHSFNNIIPILEFSDFDRNINALRTLCEGITGISYIKTIKTSTGYHVRSTTPEDIQMLKEFTGKRFKIKASGGISTLEQCKKVIVEGANIIGTSNAELIVQECIKEKAELDKKLKWSAEKEIKPKLKNIKSLN